MNYNVYELGKKLYKKGLVIKKTVVLLFCGDLSEQGGNSPASVYH